MQVETLEQIAERLDWSPERLAEAKERAAEVRPLRITDRDRTRAEALSESMTNTAALSTKPPDQVNAPNWRALRIAINDRAAIHAEIFPDTIRCFSHDDAHNVLYTFAWARPVLGRDVGVPATPYLYQTISHTACRFRRFELAPGTIVVDDITAP